MENHRILITGDYWQNDFRDVLSSLKIPTMLVPEENIKSHNFADDEFGLIVLAQARRDQFSADDIQHLQNRFPQAPIIALLGSWCEGESRSGNPAAGPIRIYWHQWQGRYDSFAEQVNADHISAWHLPRTATPVDRVVSRCVALAEKTTLQNQRNDILVAIGASTGEGFEMISDALRKFGFHCEMLEATMPTEGDRPFPDVLCINANSLSANLRANIAQQRQQFPGVPIVLVMNFPRQFEVEAARELGVLEVVSKPYELVDLKFALERAINNSKNADLTSDDTVLRVAS